MAIHVIQKHPLQNLYKSHDDILIETLKLKQWLQKETLTVHCKNRSVHRTLTSMVSKKKSVLWTLQR